MSLTELMGELSRIEHVVVTQEGNERFRGTFQMVRDRLLFAEAIMRERNHVPLTAGDLTRLLEGEEIQVAFQTTLEMT